jgi:hypothetical protein
MASEADVTAEPDVSGKAPVAAVVSAIDGGSIPAVCARVIPRVIPRR